MVKCPVQKWIWNNISIGVDNLIWSKVRTPINKKTMYLHMQIRDDSLDQLR